MSYEESLRKFHRCIWVCWGFITLAMACIAALWAIDVAVGWVPTVWAWVLMPAALVLIVIAAMVNAAAGRWNAVATRYERNDHR